MIPPAVPGHSRKKESDSIFFITEKHSDVGETKQSWSPQSLFSFKVVCVHREEEAFITVPLLCVCAKARKIACSVIAIFPPCFYALDKHSLVHSLSAFVNKGCSSMVLKQAYHWLYQALPLQAPASTDVLLRRHFLSLTWKWAEWQKDRNKLLHIKKYIGASHVHGSWCSWVQLHTIMLMLLKTKYLWSSGNSYLENGSLVLILFP